MPPASSARIMSQSMVFMIEFCRLTSSENQCHLAVSALGTASSELNLVVIERCLNHIDRAFVLISSHIGSVAKIKDAAA